MKRILVTGADGYIGTNLARRLLEEKQNRIFALVLEKTKLNVFRNSRIEALKADILDAEKINRIVSGIKPEIVFHLAGRRYPGLGKKEDLYNVNLDGTLNLFGALSKHYLKRFVFVSTADVYGRVQAPYREGGPTNPISDYGKSKYLAEMAIRVFSSITDSPFVILRLSVVYGPGQPETMFIPQLIGMIRRKEWISLTKGEQRRDFVYIDDVIDALKLAARKKDAVGQTINIASGKAMKIKLAAQKIAGLGCATGFLKIGAIPYRKDEVFDYRLSVSKAERVLGWKPRVSFEEAIQRILNYVE